MQEYRYMRLSEFFDSWDKQYEQLNHIDFAMFHMINDLGHDLEFEFFKNEQIPYDFALNKDEVANLAFTVIDTLEVFFNNKCMSCPLKCFVNPKEKLANPEDAHTIVREVFHGKNIEKRDALSLDLLNYVITPIISKYFENKTYGKKNYNKHIYKLKKFLESQLIYFLTEKYSELLSSPLDAAQGLFDELKTYDELFQSNFDNPLESGFDDFLDSGLSEEDEPWLEKTSEKASTLQRFLENVRSTFRSSYVLTKHIKSMGAFLDFVEEKHSVSNFIIKTEYMDEFFLKEFFYRFLLVKDSDIGYYFIIFAKFFRWYDDENNTHLYEHYTKLMFSNKRDLFRCQKLLRNYITQYNVIDDLFAEEDDTVQESYGFFQLKMVSKLGFLLLENLETGEVYHLVRFESIQQNQLKDGDILEVRLRKEAQFWKINELIRVFPKISKYYLF